MQTFNRPTFLRQLSHILILVVIGLGSLAAQNTTYTVRAKDTVYGISGANNMTTEDFFRLNPEVKRDGLKIGQLVRLRDTSSPRVSPPPVVNIKHRVQKGETLYSICKQYGVTQETIIKLNPEISAENLPLNFILLIPATKGSSFREEVSEKPDTVIDAEKKVQDSAWGTSIGSPEPIDTVRVSLMLPLAQGQANRYVHFYEGFLLGLNALKKNGISVIIHTYNVASSQDVDRIIASGALIGEHLIIGGTDESGIDKLADYANKRHINYVVPFNSQTEVALLGEYIFQINPPQDILYSSIAKAFVQKYQGKKVVFADENSSKRNPLVAVIIEHLKELGMEYSFQRIDKLGSLDNRTVVMPTQPSLNELKALLSQLDASGASCQLFGYPAWQSYGTAVLSSLGKYNATIYSTFYLNEADPEVEQYKNNYQAWYSHPISTGYPRYSVLGYDIARYYIRAVSTYGVGFSSHLSQIPSDGLQTDFHLIQPQNGRGSYVNANVFFVTFRQGTHPLRYSITK